MQLTATVPAQARLGQSSPLTLALRIRTPPTDAELERVELRYPASLGITTSDLGLEECARPASDYTAVLITAIGTLAGCPRNSLLGFGDVRAEVRLDELRIREEARIAMLMGPTVENRIDLAFIVTALRPFGGTLALRGGVTDAPRPYGGALTIEVPQIPSDYDATIAFKTISFTIGGDLRYLQTRRGTTTSYRPEGLVLPDRCPRDSLPFQARLRFRDGATTTTTTSLRCPAR